MSNSLKIYLKEIEGENLVTEAEFDNNLLIKDYVEKCGYTEHEANMALSNLLEFECQ